MTENPFKNEAAFSEHVRRFCKDLGIQEAYHTNRSQFSAAGFPDWVILVGDEGFALELKVGKNKPTADQLRWIAAFKRLPNWHAAVVYPDNWGYWRDMLAAKAFRLEKAS